MNRNPLVFSATLALAAGLTQLTTIESAVAGRPVQTKRTIAHECLDRELRAARHSPAARRQAYQVLDGVIADVSRRIPARFNKLDPTHARRTLSAIEGVLADRRFYVVMPTSALADTLAPSTAPPRRQRFLTEARRRAFGRSKNAPSHRMDCDTGSILYAAIGEALKLPIVVVEAPGHKFVRWNLVGSRHINWDTNAAREYHNSDYRRGRTLTCKTTITRNEETAGRFLTPLSRRDLLAYHRNIVAGILERRGEYRKAASEYRAAIAARKHDSLAANNLAWLYLDRPSMRSSANIRAALDLALRATAILPRNKDYQDTLARAYAANGRFEEAVAAERRAYNKRPHIALFRNGRAY